MIAENADGSHYLGTDGKPLEPVARRLSRKKAQLTDIILLSLERKKRQSKGMIRTRDMVNNAMAKGIGRLDASEFIAAYERSEELVDGWPGEHDTKAPVVSGGVFHGVQWMCLWPRDGVNPAII